MDLTSLRHNWTKQLDERQQKELLLARLYNSDELRHGTDGHNRLLLIDRLAQMLDRAEDKGVDLAAMWQPKA